MRQEDFSRPRTCATCARAFPAADVRRTVGWVPVRSGWRCPECSRSRAARVDAIAEVLVRGHRRHDWAGTAEHAPFDECLWCEALTAATERLLRGTDAGAAGG